MRIVLIHYHLKPGGVTTVLRQQVKAIRGFGEVLVLSGETPQTELQGEWKVIPEIGYEAKRPGIDSPRQIAESIYETIYTHWPDGCDLIHIHNPTLAKNNHFLSMIDELQKKKIPLFLQIHDFAEDGRPDVYFKENYPAHCHYGVINHRDYLKLLDAGWNTAGLHLIPNAVVNPDPSSNAQTLEECVLYPVRAIRRKNIGEAILLTLFLPHQLPLKITLPPNSKADYAAYHDWQSFVEQHHLKVQFEAGLHHAFSDLYQSARSILTTSITEGFGFGFLEPWLGGKPVWGRFLTDICSEFEKNGIRLSHLYRELMVPLAWIGANLFSRVWLAAMRSLYLAYGIQPDEKRLQKGLIHHQSRGMIDFGLLNETLQRKVLERLLTNQNDRQTFQSLNPCLQSVDTFPQTDNLVTNNAALIQEHYGLPRNRTILYGIYQKVINHRINHAIDKKRLLAEFLNPYEFSLLKWEGRED